jgi:hypothetical protein
MKSGVFWDVLSRTTRRNIPEGAMFTLCSLGSMYKAREKTLRDEHRSSRIARD